MSKDDVLIKLKMERDVLLKEQEMLQNSESPMIAAQKILDHTRTHAEPFGSPDNEWAQSPPGAVCC